MMRLVTACWATSRKSASLVCPRAADAGCAATGAVFTFDCMVITGLDTAVAVCIPATATGGFVNATGGTTTEFAAVGGATAGCATTGCAADGGATAGGATGGGAKVGGAIAVGATGGDATVGWTCGGASG
mmetsp:Transcript_21801/g.44114  ORF Transcript_21801/g.44114 Transcript_21801/m.44114 type:complete len:130 (+) Transcript_21801:1704-2093(+)